jgi:prepilin signal peptidase PulO-like enzyme (type II secretory pathway)
MVANHSWRDYFFAFRCKNCGQKTSVRVILVILLSMTVSCALIYFPFGNLNFWATIPILIFLGTILVIDIEYRVVLKETSYFGLVFMLFYGVLLHGSIPTVLGGGLALPL